MKKKLIIIMVLITSMFGCSTGDQDVVCKNTQNEDLGIIEKHTIIQEDGDLTKAIIETSFLLDKTTVSKKDYEKYAKQFSVKYEGIEGVTYSYKSSEKKFVETITFDIKNRKNIDEELLSLLTTYYGVSKKDMSVEKTVKTLEKKKYSCE